MVYKIIGVILFSLLFNSVNLSTTYVLEQWGAHQVKLSNLNSSLMNYTMALTSQAQGGGIYTYSQIETVCLALCGFSIAYPKQLQYTASVLYSIATNNITISIQIFDNTILNYLSFFVLITTAKSMPYLQIINACDSTIEGSKQINMNITLHTKINSTDSIKVETLIKSIKTKSDINSLYFGIINQLSIDSSNLKITLVSSQNISNACFTIIIINQTAIALSSLIYTISPYSVPYGWVLSLTFNISSIFTMPYNKKCLIGIKKLSYTDISPRVFRLLSVSIFKPQFFFDVTSNAIKGAIYENLDLIQLSTFCMIGQCTSKMSELYYNQTSKQCQSYSIINKCIQYLNGQDCRKCQQGYLLSDGKCIACQLSIAQCSNCLTLTQCFICNQGYSLSSDGQSCSSIAVCPTDCLYCNNINGLFTCSKCLSGYKLMNKQCTKVPQFSQWIIAVSVTGFILLLMFIFILIYAQSSNVESVQLTNIFQTNNHKLLPNGINRQALLE